MSDTSANQGKRLAMAPSAVASLILGISACCVGWSLGIPGIIVGAIGLGMSKKARAAIDANPGKYRGERFINEGRKWSLVGLIQGIVMIPLWILYFIMIFSLSYSMIR